jgi:ABC-type multidrug transport system fused ATPase/permease subunit
MEYTMRKPLSYFAVIRQMIPFARKYHKIVLASLGLTFLGASLAQVTPITLKYIVDQVTGNIQSNPTNSSLESTIILGFAILFLKELGTLTINYYLGYFGELLKVKMGVDLSNTAFEKLLSLDMSYYDNELNQVGRLTKRVDRGVEGLSKTIKNLFVDILPLFLNATTSLVVMFAVNFWVGVTSGLIIPVYFYLSYQQAEKQRGVRNSIQEISESRSAAMLNVLSSMKLVMSFQREPLEIERHKQTNKELSSEEILHHRTNRLFDGWKFFIDRAGAVLITFITVLLVLSGNASVGAIMLHLLLYDNVTSPIRHLHRIYDETNEAVTFAEGFFEILESKSSLCAENPIDISNLTLKGELQLHNVKFSYHQEHEVLHNVNLTIPAKSVALVGLSGAGKTTIANLLGRFYDPSEGSITLDGIDIKKYPLEFIRKITGYVLQDGHIFSGSIADNIRYGDLNAPTSAIIEASKMAGLHQDIERMPSGYNTNATQLSGGQKQRIAIARVFLKNPPILILDEPTASLDAIASERIQGALKALLKSRTVLIISHNLASVVNADVIYVIKEGQIIGVGDHSSLYKENEHYRNLIDANIDAMNLEKLVAVRNK